MISGISNERTDCVANTAIKYISPLPFETSPTEKPHLNHLPRSSNFVINKKKTTAALSRAGKFDQLYPNFSIFLRAPYIAIFRTTLDCFAATAVTLRYTPKGRTFQRPLLSSLRKQSINFNHSTCARTTTHTRSLWELQEIFLFLFKSAHAVSQKTVARTAKDEEQYRGV